MLTRMDYHHISISRGKIVIIAKLFNHQFIALQTNFNILQLLLQAGFLQQLPCIRQYAHQNGLSSHFNQSGKDCHHSEVV